eukprot:TRINITY_DN11265_c0_g1_i4.p1 TRINITY_DN11265_c0_g1~~TRINITY_DN11265_c0_g1_i4.p1  ORF type:complete len:100 (-),score=8.97 TRINITY_DN11265_c0_g1_i4:44-343(-)
MFRLLVSLNLCLCFIQSLLMSASVAVLGGDDKPYHCGECISLSLIIAFDACSNNLANSSNKCVQELIEPEFHLNREADDKSPECVKACLLYTSPSPRDS